MALSNASSIPPVNLDSRFVPLTNEEIGKFFNELDADNDGFVTIEELEARLELVHQEIAPKPRKHHLHHPQQRRKERIDPHSKEWDLEKAEKNKNSEHDGIHRLLSTLMPDCNKPMAKEEFTERVSSWKIPSQNQNSAEDQDKDVTEYSRRLTMLRKLRAHWELTSPKILFIVFVVALQLLFGLW
jgi:hypothetical protein